MNKIEKMFQIADKTVLVTDVDRPLGLALSNLLAETGAYVIGVGRSKEAPASFDGACYQTANCAVEAEVEALVQTITEKCGGIDVLLNVPWVESLRLSFEDYEDDFYDDAYERVIRSSFLLAKYVGKVFLQQGKGSFINIGESAGRAAVTNNAVPHSMRNALANLTRSCALEWCQKGPRANIIMPGVIATDGEEISPIVEFGSDMARFYYPCCGRAGRPEDLLGMIIYLASDASLFTNGSVMFCDGATNVGNIQKMD